MKRYCMGAAPAVLASTPQGARLHRHRGTTLEAYPLGLLHPKVPDFLLQTPQTTIPSEEENGSEAVKSAAQGAGTDDCLRNLKVAHS
jgi:hypothetical protein